MQREFAERHPGAPHNSTLHLFDLLQSARQFRAADIG
jgi:hypothetical protein